MYLANVEHSRDDIIKELLAIDYFEEYLRSRYNGMTIAEFKELPFPAQLEIYNTIFIS